MIKIKNESTNIVNKNDVNDILWKLSVFFDGMVLQILHHRNDKF